MRQSVLVGGLLSLGVSVISALVAPGCAGGGAGGDDGFGTDGDGGLDAGLGKFDGSLIGNADGAQTGNPNEDAANLQTCVHDTDCTSPNLCQGDNGVECAGGFCVPSGKPMNCDDGVPCTSDSCDATSNKCVHTPTDQSCPDGEYCDPILNCVQQLPCTPGDSVCDRLDTSACDGLWSCDPVKSYCTQGPIPCPSRANAATVCSASPVDGGVVADAGAVPVDCSWTCASGFVDVNGDLNAPIVDGADGSTGSNGCECQVTNAVDVPDLGFVDANCDGIDGTIADAIFVDKVTGLASNPGTMALPMATIAAGITAAANTTPKKSVYISKGQYTEIVTIADGVSIYGGYDASNKWQRSLGNVTEIYSSTAVGITASGLTLPVEIQLFTVYESDASGVDANSDGNSSIGVFILNASGGVTVRGCTLNAGNGAQGNPGAPVTGIGGTGGGGYSPNGGTGGLGGAGCVGGVQGGQGGNAVSGTVTGNMGDPGGGGASGGSPGGAGSCPTIGDAHSGYPGSTPANTNTGGIGAAGLAATTQFGAFDTFGNYVPSINLNAAGGTGAPGGGGGGGGAGGGTAGGTNIICSDCTNVASGAGGGGGGGGCGGPGGSPGHGGGGSFGVLAVNSTVTVDSTSESTGNGGTGGTGSAGGAGGGGGPGGPGGGPGQDGSCTNVSGGPGATGAAGATGGPGGGGAGGTGGPSICVASQGGSVSITNAKACANLLGGTGGGSQSNGNTGPTGLRGPTNPG